MTNLGLYQTVAVEALIPYARNSRTHSDEQVAQIAASIKEFGFTNPILIDENGGIIAGHGRVMAARKLGLEAVPAIRIDYLTEAQKRAYVIADNKLALNAGWDMELLALELGELRDSGFDLDLTGFSEDELANLFIEAEELPDGEGEPDDVPEVEDPVSVPGDVWLLGKHRVMCGDSTSISDAEKLMNGQVAQLLHADPPYGMGKASDGVANDNLYEDELDRFQMEWWATFRTFLTDNASAYIWGNAPELWRLWYVGGLGTSERLEMRNQIVWDKKSAPGMAAAAGTSFVTTTEHCLFFQIGNQFLGNLNADEFPEVWEPIRGYLAAQADLASLKPADVKRVCGCGMYSHWFTRSQFTLIPQNHYQALAAEYPGCFERPWKELKKEWDRVKSNPQNDFQGGRSFFDNAHDAMRDVWEFGRVVGEERHGHATPKPVEMMARVMYSSLPAGGLCIEPFGGSGSTLMGAEVAGRVCYTMELQGKYVDVIVRRWQKYTGKAAILESTGQTFEDLANDRKAAA